MSQYLRHRDRVVSSDIARLAHRTAIAKLRLYSSAAGAEFRRGPGWWAVRTGVQSNELNGVVSDPKASITPELVAELITWFGSTPASWWTWPSDASLTGRLLEAGVRPERTGIWSGADISTLDLYPTGSVVRVETERQFDLWLGLAVSAGWIVTDDDLAVRRSMASSLGLDHPSLRHWLAIDEQRLVGFATSFLCGDVVELTALGVIESHRRRGIGRRLTSVRLADAVASGAHAVVSSPSSDGWALQRSLGFCQVPVEPDTCFYLPSQ